MKREERVSAKLYFLKIAAMAAQDPYFGPKYPFPISARERALHIRPAANERGLSKTTKSFIWARKKLLDCDLIKMKQVCASL